MSRLLIPVVLCATVLWGCASQSEPGGRVLSRMTPEELSALQQADPSRAAEATRLTQQADREARAAQEAQRRRELDEQRRRDYERLERWHYGIGYWHPYPRWGWGGWYGLP